VFWKVYPKHSDDFDTQRLEFDWLARAFRRGAPPHRSRMRRRTADGAD
jgi:hypothetical protein